MVITPKGVFKAAARLAAFDARSTDFSDVRQTDADLSSVDLVIAPLFGVEYDGIELIERLRGRKFKGRLQLVSMALPDHQLVLDELLAAAAGTGIHVELTECY